MVPFNGGTCRPTTPVVKRSVLLTRYHRAQSYSRDKTDWTVQSWKLLKKRRYRFEIPTVYRYRQKNSNIVTGVKIQKDILETMANLCALSVFLLSRKKIVTHRQDETVFIVPSTK